MARLVVATDGPRMYVVDDDTDVIGFVLAGPSRDDDAGARTGEVISIHVRPDRWRSGAGTLLLTAAADHLRDHGFADATLWVLERNATARSFYERSGWVADGTEKTLDIAGAALAEVRYRRAL